MTVYKMWVRYVPVGTVRYVPVGTVRYRWVEWGNLFIFTVLFYLKMRYGDIAVYDKLRFIYIQRSLFIINQLSTYWALGLLGSRTIGLSDYWALGLLGSRTIGLSDYWAVGVLGCRCIGLLDYWAVGVLHDSDVPFGYSPGGRLRLVFPYV